jgi:hypothetical protein
MARPVPGAVRYDQTVAARLGLALLFVHVAASAASAGAAVGLPELAWGTEKAVVRKGLPKGFGACRPSEGTPFGTEACPIAVEDDRLSPYGTWLYFRDGALVGWVVRSDPADRKAMLAALRQRFGAPTEEADARTTWRGAVALVWTTFALRDGDFDATYAVTLDALARAPADREAARPREPPATPRADERGEDADRRSRVDESIDGGKGESRRRGLPPRWR